MLQFGIVLPNTEIGSDTAAVTEWSRGAESEGFDSIVVWDHVVGAEHADRQPPITREYDERTPFREPLTLLAYLAGTTTSVGLVTGVLVLPQRQTALVAKQAAEIDLLSGGRLTLGVGNGWNLVEYEVLGADFRARGDRLAEGVEVIRRLWTEELVNFRGRYHTLDRVALCPRPSRDIPIVFGGASIRAVKRAAVLGDGYIFGVPSPETLEHLRALEADLDELNRDRTRFSVTLQVHAATDRDQLMRSVEEWLPNRVDSVYVSTMRSRQGGAGVDAGSSAAGHLELACLTREALLAEFGGE